jgi:predicted Na+-dependent transporter
MESGRIVMTVDRLIKILASITLIEMMVTVGLGVTLSDVLQVSRRHGLVALALVANYILVPLAAFGLLFTAAVRNVGVAPVIVSSSFPGTAAITSTTVYALFQTVFIVLVAIVGGRFAPRGMIAVKTKAA